MGHVLAFVELLVDLLFLEAEGEVVLQVLGHVVGVGEEEVQFLAGEIFLYRLLVPVLAIPFNNFAFFEQGEQLGLLHLEYLMLHYGPDDLHLVHEDSVVPSREADEAHQPLALHLKADRGLVVEILKEIQDLVFAIFAQNRDLHLVLVELYVLQFGVFGDREDMVLLIREILRAAHKVVPLNASLDPDSLTLLHENIASFL